MGQTEGSDGNQEYDEMDNVTTVTKRTRDAKAAQNGACNPRAVAQALLDAIDATRAEDKSEREDDDVFMLVHQLAFLLADADFCSDSAELTERYARAYKRLFADD